MSQRKKNNKNININMNVFMFLIGVSLFIIYGTIAFLIISGALRIISKFNLLN